MENIFANADTKVEAGYTTKKALRKIDIVSEQALSSMYLREHAKQERKKEIDAVIESMEKEEHMQELATGVARRNMMESQFCLAIDTFGKKVKDYIFKDILTEVYVNAILIDEDFVKEHYSDFTNTVSNYVDSNGGFKLLESAIERTDSRLLKKIKAVCEKTANKICSRKIKEATDTNDVQYLNFDINTEEEDILAKGKSEISADEISDLVKDKVLTVIKDEKERQAKEDELKADVENELSDNEDVTDIDTAKEAFNKMVIADNPIEEATLFSSLLRHTCNEYLVESVMGTTVVGNSEYDVDTTEDDVINNAANEDEVNLKKEYDADDLTVGMRESGNTIEVKMETALADTIAQYTLMETLYTLKLEDYTYGNIKKLSMKLLKPITK